MQYAEVIEALKRGTIVQECRLYITNDAFDRLRPAFRRIYLHVLRPPERQLHCFRSALLLIETFAMELHRFGLQVPAKTPSLHVRTFFRFYPEA